MQLLSHPLCPYVHRAAALLTERGVAFELRHVDLQRKPDWFLAISPRGKVPVLVTDEGTAIFESLVILEYLDERYALRMLPDEPLARAQQRMWIALSDDLMSGHYKIAVARSEAERDAARAATRETLARFERVVAGPWFNGDAPALVDFAAGPALLRLDRIDRWLELGLFDELPKVRAWTDAVLALPAFTETLVPEFDDRLRALVNDLDAAA